MRNIFDNLNLGLNEIQNVKAQVVATDPTTGLVAGRFIYNSAEKLFKYYNGTEWVTASAAGVTSVTAATGETVIVVDNTDTQNPKVSFAIAATQGTGVTVTKETDGVKVNVQDATTAQQGIVALTSTRSETDEEKATTPKGAFVKVDTLETPDEGYFKTTVIYQGGVEIGRIQQAKDYFLETATLGTVTQADKDEGGKFYDASKYAEFLVGDAYIDLVVYVKSGGTEGDKTHLYILCKKLGKFTYRVGGTIAVGDTTATLALPAGSTYLGSLFLDENNDEALCSVRVAEATATAAGSVTFSIAQAYTNALNCYITYIA